MLRYTAVFLAGVLAASLAFMLAGSHYRLQRTGNTVLRMNNWTGRAYTLYYHNPETFSQHPVYSWHPVIDPGL